MSAQLCPYCRRVQEVGRDGACAACGRELPPLGVAAGPPPLASPETAIRPAPWPVSADPAAETLVTSATARKELERLERVSFAAIEGLDVGLAQPLPAGADA